MKFTASLIASLFAFSALAETFEVGGTKINITPPQGFGRATKKIEREFADEFAEAGSDPIILAVYIPEDRARNILDGLDVGFDRSYVLMTHSDLMFRTSARDFMEIKREMMDIWKEIRKEAHEQLAQRGVPIPGEKDMNGIGTALLVVPELPFDFHYETDSALAFSKYDTAPDTLLRRATSSHRVSTFTTFNVAGQMLMLMCAAPMEEIEWTRTASKAWVESIFKENFSATSRSLKEEEALQRGREVAMKAGFVVGTLIGIAFFVGIPLAIIILIIFLLVKCFKKKSQQQTHFPPSNFQRQIRVRKPGAQSPKPPPLGVEAACPCCGQTISIPANFKGAANCPICKQAFNVE